LKTEKRKYYLNSVTISLNPGNHIEYLEWMCRQQIINRLAWWQHYRRN